MDTGDVWDDSEILSAFNSAIESHRFAGRAPKRTRKDSNPEEKNIEIKQIKKLNNMNYEESETHQFLQQRDYEKEQLRPLPSGLVCSVCGLAEKQASAALQEEAMSTMMMAWYQSGYATGRYEALMQMKQGELAVKTSDTMDRSSVEGNTTEDLNDIKEKI